MFFSANDSEQAHENHSIALTGSRRRTLLMILLVALVIRLAASVLFVFNNSARWADPKEDHWTYAYEAGRIARSLATGHGFSSPLRLPSGPTTWLPPVYPLIFAGVFKVFGIYSTASALAMRVFDSVVSALTCIPICLIGRRFGDRMGTWAAWAWAFFPHGVYSAAVVTWDSSLSAPILTCLVWLTLEVEKSRSLPAWVGYGALWGLGGLTNPTMLAALPFLLGWLWFRQASPRRLWILRPGTTILASLIVMAPWIVRNYLVFHQPFLLKSNFWLEFVIGNGEGQWSYTITAMSPEHNPSELRDYVQIGEVEYMAQKRRAAMDFLLHHPALYAWLCVRRFSYVWTGFWSFKPKFLASNTDGGLRHIALTSAYTIPFLLGLWRAFRLKTRTTWLLAAVLFSVPFVTYLTHPFGYYRYIIDPEIVFLAVYGLVPLLSLWAAKEPSPQQSEPFPQPALRHAVSSVQIPPQLGNSR